MKSSDQASELVAQTFKQFPIEKTDVNLLEITDAILAEDILADRDYPPFDRAMMDGIAVSFLALQEGLKQFRICEVIAAGSVGKKLESPNDCVEIMTGAMVVENADVVIPYEHLTIENKIASLNFDPQIYKKLENIHTQGSDIKLGEVILKKYSDLKPTHLAIAASVGAHKIKIKQNYKIAVISTGDELVDIKQTPKQYEIRKSNVYAIASALKNFGHNEVELFHLKDSKEDIENFMSMNMKKYNLMFFSGGVSKGKYDYLPEVWKKLQIQEIFHGVAQRPGKPLWFGKTIKDDLIVYGLPGNPISSLICLYRYFLQFDQQIWGKLGREIIFNKNMTYFVPVKVNFTKNGNLEFLPELVKNSGEFAGLAYTDGFIELPAEQNEFKLGEIVKFYPWKKWL